MLLTVFFCRFYGLGCAQMYHYFNHGKLDDSKWLKIIVIREYAFCRPNSVQTNILLSRSHSQEYWTRYTCCS